MPDDLIWYNVPGAISALEREAVDFLEGVGDDILVRAQRLVPKRSWSLHDSLTQVTEVEGIGHVTTSVGVDEDFTGYTDTPPRDYAALVEDGTSKMEPQPYLMPALLQIIGGL